MTPRRILFAAWSVFVLFGYPGFMHSDALDELVDSRVGAITDWHSPIFTEVWRVLGRVISGPAPLFLLQGTMLLLGAYSLARRAVSDRAAAYAAAFVMLFPPLLATSAIVCEDATLAAFLVAGAAVLVGESRARKLGGLALLVIACGLHEGASLAVLPIVAAGLRWPSSGRWRQLGVAILAWLALVGCAVAIDRMLVEERSHRREIALAIFDIHGTDHSRPAQPTTDDERDELLARRRTLSREMPGAYLRYRVHVFERVLGFSRNKKWIPVFTEFVEPAKERLAIAHAAHHSLVQRILEWPVKKLGHTFLFRPFIYFFIGLVLLPIAVVRRHGVAVTLLVSGLAYELALGLVTYDVRFTASQWMIATTAMSAIVISVRELKARHERVFEQTAVAVAHDDRV